MFDANQINLILQLPVVGLFCIFIVTLLKSGREYLQQQDEHQRAYLVQRDEDMKESLEKVAKSLENLGNRVQQNTLIIIAYHPEMSPQERQQILNKL